MQGAPSTREAARIELIRAALPNASAQERAMAYALKLSAKTLRVERVGIWLMDDAAEQMDCYLLYALSTDSLRRGGRLAYASCPHYVQALREWRAISANDALRDPRTSELTDYLARHHIRALLDSPIFQQGRPVGVLCHEDVTPGGRAWSKEDAHFASTVADMVGLYLEQAERHRVDEALREAQAELEQTRVMESLGRMATAVAHDFNNVLMAIVARSAVPNLPSSDSRAERARYAQDMEELVEQGARLVRQLTAFAMPRRRASSSEPRACADLGTTLRGMGTFLKTLDADGVSVELQIEDGRHEVPLSRVELEQIVTNLAVNARDAMLGGGSLLISVEHRAGKLCLQVQDTGVGMDRETRERVFEPFFSTKGEKVGRGLGLATVYQLVKHSGGTIRVDSGVGQGTTFRLEWPCLVGSGQ